MSEPATPSANRSSITMSEPATPSTNRKSKAAEPSHAPKQARLSLQPSCYGTNKSIRCAIHGNIEVEPLLVKVMDEPIYQRLRNLRQLGCADRIYPTATHSRFDHSLGVAHLAGELCKELQRQPYPKGASPPSERDILCVKLAGLCHDLGHGPFSHTFEKIAPNFKHETMSTKLLDVLFKGPERKLRLSDFSAGGEPLQDEEDLLFVKELINSDGRRGRTRDKWYLYEIIANKSYGLDVDRLDYLLRDSQNSIGIGPGFALDVILSSASVRMMCDKGGEVPEPIIAYSKNAASELWKVFQMRFEMFSKVYMHPGVVGCELLLRELLRAFSQLPAPGCHVLAGKTLDEAAVEPADFALLNDGILERLKLQLELLQLDIKQGKRSLSPAESEQVEVTKGLLERYNRHSLYGKLAEAVMPTEGKFAAAKEAELQEAWGLPADRFQVVFRKVHHGDGDKNPMRDMRFFDPKRDDLDTPAEKLDAMDRWLPLPRFFERKTVCVYFTAALDGSTSVREERTRARDEVRLAWLKTGFPDQPDDDDDDELPASSQGYEF